MEKKYNGKAIASLVVSCLAVLNVCLWYFAILCGIIGVVLGILALRDDNKKQQDLAIAGIVVGGVGLSLGIAAAVLYIMVASAADGATGLDAVEGTALLALRHLASHIQ